MTTHEEDRAPAMLAGPQAASPTDFRAPARRALKRPTRLTLVAAGVALALSNGALAPPAHAAPSPLTSVSPQIVVEDAARNTLDGRASAACSSPPDMKGALSIDDVPRLLVNADMLAQRHLTGYDPAKATPFARAWLLTRCILQSGQAGSAGNDLFSKLYHTVYTPLTKEMLQTAVANVLTALKAKPQITLDRLRDAYNTSFNALGVSLSVPSVTSTSTPPPAPTATPSPTASATPAPSASPTATATPAPSPTASATPSATPVATPAPTTCGGKPATIVGTEVGNNIAGTAGNDVILGLGGGDIIDGAGGDDVICGGDGNDVIRGSVGQDTIDGGAGNDSIDGGDGADRCVLADRDALSYCESTGASMFALTGASDGAPAGPMPTCNGKAATIVGTEMGDILSGTDRDDVFVTLGGGDVIDAGAGNDTICGGAGRDDISGGAGIDWIDGGTDADRIKGGSEVDILTGGDGEDVLLGESGNDNLEGGLGRDVLEGGLDDDLLVGGGGNDALRGDEGNDVLDGGPGDPAEQDALDGKAGNDACVTVTAPSTSESCEGLAKLVGVAGASISHRATTLTVPAGLLTAPAYAAIRHELAGDRITKNRYLGNLEFVDLFADWKGRGSVTLSMPFDATGITTSGTQPAVYRFGDDGSVGVLKNLRLNQAGTQVEFETTALSGFTGAACDPRMDEIIPGFCRDLYEYRSEFLSNQGAKVENRDSIILTVACGVGAIAALAEPTPFAEAAIMGGCFKAVVGELVTPPDIPDPERRALDCSTSAAPLQYGGLGAGYRCMLGVAEGELSKRLGNAACNHLNCQKIDAAVEQRREAKRKADAEAAAQANQTPSSSVPPSSNASPQGGTYDPQGGNYNPQGGNYNPQGGNYNPQGGNYNPQP